MPKQRTLLDLGPTGGQHWFASVEELREWISREQEFWRETIDNGPGGARDQVESVFNALMHTANEATRDQQPVSWLVEQVQPRYSERGQLVESSSEEALSIRAISQTIGRQEAGFAYAMLKGWANLRDAPRLADTKAALRLLLPSLVPVETARSQFRAERDSFRDASRRLQAEMLDAEAARSAGYDALMARIPAALLRQMRRHHAEQKRQLDAWRDTVKEAVDSFRNTEAVYREHMELAGPVDYWTKKATAHQTSEKAMLSRVLWYFGVATVIIVVAFAGVGWLLLDLSKTSKVDNTVLVVAGAGLAAFTTMLLWGGRLITRLYLSQNHLRHDAEERAVMTKTFLALTSVRQAEEKDRQIILTALFRQTSDGIVKDDGAPEIGLSGFASKFLGGR